MKASKKYSISWRDVAHGFITAFLSAALTGVMTCLGTGHLPTLPELQAQVLIGLSAGLAYLLKKFITNSEGKIGKPEQKKTLQ